jgi:predicted LPLAT superfamily acyltransferase
VFSYRSGHFRYEIHICSPIEIPRDAGDDVLARAAQSAATEMERFIRSHPTHWFHFEPGVRNDLMD